MISIDYTWFGVWHGDFGAHLSMESHQHSLSLQVLAFNGIERIDSSSLIPILPLPPGMIFYDVEWCEMMVVDWLWVHVGFIHFILQFHIIEDKIV